MSALDGRYPGGPRRPGREAEGGPRHDPDLSTAEEIENRSARRQMRSARRRRRRRSLIGFVLAFLVAGTAGFWLGWRSHRTSEEIAREVEERPDPEIDLTRERDAILQQLWLMEDLERARRP